jgi:superfamily II DNA/RNA helicase
MVTNETFEEQFGDVIPAWLLSKARECGWTHPTYAQQSALQSIFRDNCRNVLLQAETGSGKTLAYLVPCLSRIDPTRSSLQAVVVVPTRELGLQVAKVARRLASGYHEDETSAIQDDPTEPELPRSTKMKGKILVMNVLQGSKNRRQRAWAWAEPPHVVIGTPPELLDMVAKGGFKRYNSVRTLIVDEVDACLLNNMGSVVVSSSSASYASSPGSGSIQLSGTTLHELLSKYLSPTYVDSTIQEAKGGGADFANLGGASSKPRRPVERRRLTLFCSATIPQPRHFVKQCVQNQWMLQEPVHVRCQANPSPYEPQQQSQTSSSSSSFAPMLPSSLVHQYVVCADQDQKMVTLRRLIQRIHSRSASSQDEAEPKKKVLVFCDPRRPMKDMATIIGRDLDRVAVAAAAASVERKQEEEEGAPEDSPIGSARDAVVSVLSLEDSLTERADAMAAFRGDDAGDLGRFGNEQDCGDDADDDNEGNDSNLSPGFSSPWSSPHISSNARTRILLSSDLAARGLDIVDITHVIHFDLPINADAVRRICATCSKPFPPLHFSESHTFYFSCLCATNFFMPCCALRPPSLLSLFCPVRAPVRPNGTVRASGPGRFDPPSRPGVRPATAAEHAANPGDVRRPAGTATAAAATTAPAEPPMNGVWAVLVGEAHEHVTGGTVES